MSQIGYMFLALGVGAWAAAIFHFVTHAFFKALLFLCAGVVIQALERRARHLQDGGAAKSAPLLFWAFLIGAASLSALPFVTAGFYSKEAILELSLASAKGGWWLWAGALAGAFLTALYAFRLLFRIFFGRIGQTPGKGPVISMVLPIVVLAALSIFGGFVQLPQELGGFSPLSDFLRGTLPAAPVSSEHCAGSGSLFLVAVMAPLAGLFAAYRFFLSRPERAEHMARTGPGMYLYRFWSAGWGFDALYDFLVVRPFKWFSRANRDDFVDLLYNGIAGLNIALNAILVLTQSGSVRRYAVAIAAGVLAMIAVIALS